MAKFCFNQFLVLFILLVCVSMGAEPERISRPLLIEDITQLADVFESSHPDPYTRGGGKIAFHKRLHELKISIPLEGLTKESFEKRLLPFVASVGDGHTRIHVKYKINKEQPGGIPLIFGIIEDSLYVSGVFDKNYKNLLGSVLVSVQDIPFENLCERIRRLRGTDNRYGALALLAGANYLFHESQLADLIPEWNGDGIRVELKLPSGKTNTLVFATRLEINRPEITAESAVQVPSTERREFDHCFLDGDKKTALLKVDGMVGFRENFELVGLDSEYSLDGARYYYRRFHQKAPPEDKDELLNGIPSATETFESLVKEMKQSGTDTLIVDLRHNGGGNSTLGNFLIYFLYGKERLLHSYTRKTGYEIIKYSKLYFDQVPQGKRETGHTGIELGDSDYWFEEFYETGRFELSKIRDVHEDLYKKIPTFYKEYKSGKYSNHYRPEKVVVLCSPKTYSSGYTMMKMLNELGAPLVGAPSSQNENAPGWILNFKLKHSGLSGWVPCKFYVSFSDRIKNGVYRVDHLFTYKMLKRYGFDPNSEILFALDLLEGQR